MRFDHHQTRLQILGFTVGYGNYWVPQAIILDSDLQKDYEAAVGVSKYVNKNTKIYET